MKHWIWLVMALLAFPSVAASPSSEEFVIEDLEDGEIMRTSTQRMQGHEVSQPTAPSVPALHPSATSTPQPSKLIRVVQGAASWYGPGFYGRKTASGERFRKGTMTAAHRTLPFGSKVRVTNLSNGRSVVVRINDRGPFKYHRVIDLAHGAASQLKMMKAGEVPVKLEILSNSD